MPSAPPPQTPVNPQKARRGLNRLVHALIFSLNGLKAAWGESAFRLEVWLSAVMVPGAFWLGTGWLETAFLLATVVLVLVAELINTAVESTIDRIGLQWHDLSKRAKDLGSAAVLLCMLLCAFTWGVALWHRFFG